MSRPNAETRFGIIHMMMWAVTTALYMGIQRLVIPSEFVTNLHGLQLAGMICESLGGGAALGGLFITIVRFIKSPPFPAYPGEWLWFFIGLRIVLAFIASALTPMFIAPFVALWLSFGCAALLYLLAAIATHRMPAWLSFFSVACAIQTLQCYLAWGFPSFYFDFAVLLQPILIWFGEPILPAVILAIIVWRDLQRKAVLPWTHWAGIAAYLVYGSATVFSFIAFNA
jgi:hypothetical protein